MMMGSNREGVSEIPKKKLEFIEGIDACSVSRPSSGEDFRSVGRDLGLKHMALMRTVGKEFQKWNLGLRVRGDMEKGVWVVTENSRAADQTRQEVPRCTSRPFCQRDHTTSLRE